MLTNNVALFERAYDDLTEAVARAKKVCRNYTRRQSPSKVASKIPKESTKRGRPKGSKDSKPRNHKQSESTPAGCELASHPESNRNTSGVQSSNDHLSEVPALPNNGSDIGVDGYGDVKETSFSDSFFSHDDFNTPIVATITYPCAQHSMPACWILPLP